MIFWGFTSRRQPCFLFKCVFKKYRLIHRETLSENRISSTDIQIFTNFTRMFCIRAKPLYNSMPTQKPSLIRAKREICPADSVPGFQRSRIDPEGRDTSNIHFRRPTVRCRQRALLLPVTVCNSLSSKVLDRLLPS